MLSLLSPEMTYTLCNALHLNPVREMVDLLCAPPVHHACDIHVSDSRHEPRRMPHQRPEVCQMMPDNNINHISTVEWLGLSCPSRTSVECHISTVRILQKLMKLIWPMLLKNQRPEFKHVPAAERAMRVCRDQPLPVRGEYAPGDLTGVLLSCGNACALIVQPQLDLPASGPARQKPASRMHCCAQYRSCLRGFQLSDGLPSMAIPVHKLPVSSCRSADI